MNKLSTTATTNTEEGSMTTFGITMTATYIGERADGDQWKHNLWDIVLERNGQTMNTQFRMGLGLVDPPKRTSRYPRRSDEFPTPRKPELPEVLSSLAADARVDLWDEYDDLFGGMPYSKVRLMEAACKRTVLDLRRLLGRDFDRFIETDWEV